MTFPREVTPGKFLGFRHSLPRGLGYEDPGSLQARRFPNAIFLKGNTLFVREMRQKTRYGTFFSLSFNDVLQWHVPDMFLMLLDLPCPLTFHRHPPEISVFLAAHAL